MRFGDAFRRSESTWAGGCSRRLPEEDGDGSEVEVDEVLGLYESGSVAHAHHTHHITVPGVSPAGGGLTMRHERSKAAYVSAGLFYSK
jgi:hypothetical protein